MKKTRLRDLSKTFPRFRDPAKIFRDPRFFTIRHPSKDSAKGLVSEAKFGSDRISAGFYQRVDNPF